MTSEELVYCFQDTYEKSNGTLRDRTVRAIESNRIYREGFISAAGRRNEKATIEVIGRTTFDVASRYCAHGKVAVLNFANPETPGGGVQQGAMAQEECLCRSSNLFACLSDPALFEDYYGYHRRLRNTFYTDRLIYTEGVTVFKNDEPLPQPLPEEDWFEVDVITCAAPYIGRRKYTNVAALLNLFKARIKNIFEAAREHQVDYLILGAFGCGAFKNPPVVVAEAFLQTIREQDYFRDFRQIIFAIKPTGEFCENLQSFQNQFDQYSPDARWRGVLLPHVLDIRFHQKPALPAENRFDRKDFWNWQKDNPYFGKQFSIFGDGISTLEGFNPRSNRVFYTEKNSLNTQIITPEDTWWDKVIRFFGGELLVNDSSANRRIPLQTEVIGALHINEVLPDVIIVSLGAEDWCADNGTGSYECFKAAYHHLLKRLTTLYPQSEIWCCGLFAATDLSQPAPRNSFGIPAADYSEAICKAAQRNGCRFIDLQEIACDTVDGFYPTAHGMNALAAGIIRGVMGAQVNRFLNAPDSKIENPRCF